MAITLVIEDGTAKADANTYVSLADAGAYLANSGRTVGAWGDAGAEGQKGALVRAWNYILSRWSVKFLGYPATDTQAGDWPRINAPTLRGTVYNSNEIPGRLIWAQIEYALVEAETPGALSPNPTYDDTGRPVIKTRQKVDVIETETQYAEAKAQPETWRKHPIGDGMIRPLLKRSGTLLRV